MVGNVCSESMRRKTCGVWNSPERTLPLILLGPTENPFKAVWCVISFFLDNINYEHMYDPWCPSRMYCFISYDICCCNQEFQLNISFSSNMVSFLSLEEGGEEGTP